MLFTLDICVNKKATPTYSVHSGLNRPSPPPPHLRNITSSFAKCPIKSANYSSLLFLGNSRP